MNCRRNTILQTPTSSANARTQTAMVLAQVTIALVVPESTLVDEHHLFPRRSRWTRERVTAVILRLRKTLPSVSNFKALTLVQEVEGVDKERNQDGIMVFSFNCVDRKAFDIYTIPIRIMAF